MDIATLRLPDRNFGGLYTDIKKDVNPWSIAIADYELARL
jgi:hypothetical protein